MRTAAALIDATRVLRGAGFSGDTIEAARSQTPAVTPSSSFALQELATADPLLAYRRRLAMDGVTLPVVVNGAEIEFELRCGHLTLMATSYDYYEGWSHWIYLLQQDGKPLDQIALPDQGGFLQNLEVISPAEIEFGFYGTHDRWHLMVHASGFWSFAPRILFSRPGGLWLSRRRMALRHTKGGVCSEPATSGAIEAADSGRPDQAAHFTR